MLNLLRRIRGGNSPSGIAFLPKLTAAEQTKLTWAKSIDSYEALPEVFKEYFDPFLLEGREFPYTVLTPSYEGFIHRTSEKLICEFDREIHVLERSGNGFEARCYPLECISYVEARTVLLDAYIKISGAAKNGVPALSILRFNSVTDYLFTPILEAIRLAQAQSKEAVLSSELKKFDQWAMVNFKFMNYARRSLVGGEKVIHTILQPEIRRRAFSILGLNFYRSISPTHVCILTDRELILIQEEERRGEAKYGGVWDYVPLNKIVSLSLNEKDGNLIVLSIELPENTHLERIFQASAGREIDRLLDRYQQHRDNRITELMKSDEALREA
jgi:hypothetical protein